MSVTRSSEPVGYSIGDLEVDLAGRRVSRGNRDIRLGKLSYRLLVALARSAPGVLSQDDMVEAVWDGRFVNPPTVKQRITILRRALGDDSERPEYIRVVRGHGYTLIPPVEPRFQPLSPKKTFALAPIAAVLLLLLAGAALFVASRPTPPPAGPAFVAVLPFVNLSPDPEDSYFATGLHEEIIDRLAEIDGLEVVSRQSVLPYSDTQVPVATIAGELGVDAVMSGSVDYHDGRLRIRTQLTDPVSGLHMWSETFDREFADVFDVQDEIATSVAGALGVRLGILSANAFRGAGTTSIEAYEAFLAGLHSLRQPLGHERAITFFERATEIDPGYAAAWAQLGFAIAAKTFYSPPQLTAEILDQAMPHMLKAVELDPQSARAATMLGFVRYSRLDWIGAEKEHTRAIELQANHLTLAQHATLLVRAGRMSAAQSEFEAAESLRRPADQAAAMLVQVSIAQKRFAEARELALRENAPVLRHRLLLNIALNEGNADEIKRAMAELVMVEPASRPLFVPLMRDFDLRDAALATIDAAHKDSSANWPAKQHDIALLAAYFGDPYLAMASIDDEVSQSAVRLWALWYPVMSEVRQMLEFKDLVTRLNLVAYWRAYGWPDACAPTDETDFRCS